MAHLREMFFDTEKIFHRDWAKQVGQTTQIGASEGGNFAVWGP